MTFSEPVIEILVSKLKGLLVCKGSADERELFGGQSKPMVGLGVS